MSPSPMNKIHLETEKAVNKVMLTNVTSHIAWEKRLGVTSLLGNVNQINYLVLLTVQEANGFSISVDSYLPRAKRIDGQR